MKPILLYVALLFVSVNAFAASNSYDPTESLIRAFEGSCQSVGQHTVSALNQTASLKSVIEEMKSDQSCNEIQNSLDGVLNATSQMANLLGPSNAGFMYNQKEAEIGQLLAAIGTETNDVTKSYLSSQLASDKIDYIKMGGESNRQRRQMLYSTAGAYLKYSENALAALGSRSTCMSKRPGLAIQITGQILAISSNLLSSPMGPVFFALGSSVNTLVKYLGEKKHNDLLRKTSNIRLSSTLGCVMESLANSYCQARDTLTLVEANANPEIYSFEKEPQWYGLRLLARDLENYNAWINRIVSGSPPSNEAASALKTKGELLEAGLRATHSKMQALLKTGEQREKGVTDPAQKSSMRRLTMNQLIASVNGFLQESGGNPFGSSSSGIPENSPFFQTFIYDLTCGSKNFFLTGKHFVTATGTGSTRGCPAEIENPPDNMIPSIKFLSEYVDTLIIQAGQNVTNEVSRYKENDFLSILAQSERQNNGLNDAQAFLLKSDRYLNHLLVFYDGKIPPFTLDYINETRVTIKETFGNFTSTVPTESKVANIQSILAPKMDPYFLSKRLTDIAQWDLSQRIAGGTMNEGLKLIFRETLRNTFDIPKEAGVLSPDRLVSDAETSQPISYDNLKLVGEMFDSNLKNIFEEYAKQGNAIPAFGKNMARLCIQALLIPDAPRISDKLDLNKYCGGKVWRSIKKRFNLELKYDVESRKAPVDRICAVYDFYRKSAIYSKEDDSN